ncbi:MAG: protein kinase [Oscillospiraceae bacterium]|nr:protein kinase [Oscillospiraceae bacterium]
MSDIQKFEPLWGVWKIESVLGEGSFGKVYKAVREEFGKEYYCAIKHISIPKSNEEIRQFMDESMSDDRSVASEYFHQIVKNITDEISVMYSLKGNNKNIVSYEEHLVIPKENGVGHDIFIKMELLTDLLKKAKESFSVGDAVRLGIDMCSALELCNSKDLIHRDIKPQNIFISDDNHYKLGDFGIARQLEKTSSGLSKKGTNSYMAPEVFKGEDYGASVDIYSLGIVLYRLLNDNRLPFLPLPPTTPTFNDQETALQRRIQGEKIPPPSHVDTKLSNIILKMCAYNRADRYKNPSEAKNDLLAYGDKNGLLSLKGGDPICPDCDTELTENTSSVWGDAPRYSCPKCGKDSEPLVLPKPSEQPKPSEPPKPLEPLKPSEQPKPPIPPKPSQPAGPSRKGLFIVLGVIALIIGIGASAFFLTNSPNKPPPTSVPTSTPTPKLTPEPTPEPTLEPTPEPTPEPSWGLWSKWKEEKPKKSETREIESKEQYSYRIYEKKRTNSATPPDSGWKLIDTTSEWGNWGSWSGWSTSNPSQKDGREIDSRKKTIPEGTFEDENGEKWTVPSKTQTEYRYRDRSRINTYTYGRYGNWSSWEDTPQKGKPLDNDTSRSRIVYRYRELS